MLAVERLEPRTLLSVVPFGPEFRVNTHTSGYEGSPAVAMDADGDFVVTWESDGQYGSGYGVYAQRYDAAGVAQGGEFRVDSYTTGDQADPAVATDADGDFVVAWSSDGQDGSGWGIYAQRYDAVGLRQGGEFCVNTYTTLDQKSPAVAMDAAGNFVVTWSSAGQDGSDHGVYAQRYDAAGVVQGSEFRVNTYATDSQRYPTVAMDADGDFVVTWESDGQDGSYDGIYAQRYDAAGLAQGGEFRVNTYTTSSQSGPAVAMDAAGDFVVTWQSYGQDGSYFGVYAQRYNAAGVRRGGEFPVNTYTTDWQWQPAVAMDAAGNFVVTWESVGQDGSYSGVYAQRCNAAGVRQGGEFLVNTYTTLDQKSPAVAMGAAGNFVVTWESDGQDGSYSGVYAQRYADLAALEGVVWDDLDADGVRDTGEPGLDGVEVRLLRSTGQMIATTVTSGGGKYAFDALQARLPLVVEVVRPWGRRFSPPNIGGNDSRDSDVDPLTGRSAPFTLAARDGRQAGPDAGLFQGENVTGTVYRDANGNGSREPGEVGLGAWIVYWDANENGSLDPGEPSALSDWTGAYRIEDLRPGACLVAVVDQPHWLPTAARVVTLISRQTVDGVDFANRKTVPDTDARPAGHEFRVNSYTSDYQWLPAVAMDAAGNFVVAWHSNDQDGSAWGVYAQRYNAAGTRRGGEFRVNTYTSSQQEYPAVAMDAAGNFVVTWMSSVQDGDGRGIYAQRYNAAGLAQGGEFRVNTYTAGDQQYPAVAMDAAGNFVVTWESDGQDGSLYGICAQRYDAAGVPQGGEFPVNTYTSSHQESPAVAMDAVGNFVVAWHSDGQDGSGCGVYAQRYDAAGLAQGDEFRVNSYTTDDQQYPAVAMDAVGNFVVTWRSYAQDGSDHGVYAQRYDATGVRRGGEFPVNTFTTDDQQSPAVAMDAAGNFVVTWASDGQDESGYGVYAQRYDAAGVVQGGEFRVNSYTSASQWYPAVATDPAGNFVVTWASDGQDGSGYGVYAQRYDVEVVSVLIDRYVFYNRSAFDGSDPAPDARDDSAIATDKRPLLPGQTATFANYTSYSRGINGIMVEIAGLPEGKPGDRPPLGPPLKLTTADFRFRAGNTTDPSTWAAAPNPTSVTVRKGEGVDGSDLVTLVWPDNVIQKKWLQVTMLATPNTRLREPDVFYFGNAIGETGNSTTDANVNAFDMLGARDNPRSFLNPAPIDFAYDFNRDRRVNATDMLIARDNPTSFLNALKLITVPARKLGAAVDRAHFAAAHDRGAHSAPYEPIAAADSVGWEWLDALAQRGARRNRQVREPMPTLPAEVLLL